MSIRIFFLTVFINCLIFAQSDKSVYNTAPGITENGIEYSQNTSTDIHQIYLPYWYETVTQTPSNMLNVVTNSFTSGNLPVLGYISALTTALVITDSKTHSAVKTFFMHSMY